LIFAPPRRWRFFMPAASALLSAQALLKQLAAFLQ
jgi:hypothetical protein